MLAEGSVQAQYFEQVAAKEHITYKEFHANGYIVYEPEKRIAP